MAGILYVVGTPIGNMGDISIRALEMLNEVDFIAAEDTRVTLKLLNRHNIKKPLISYREHNAYEQAEVIISRLKSDESCAVVSDAGMPCISDPGEILVRLCHENDIEVKAIPGANAAVTALAISGMSTSRFAFEGFLSVSKKHRREHLESISEDTHTLIFYEAPHKLKATLADLYNHLGDRNIALCREITKIYEETLRMTLSEAIGYYKTNTPKGEFVIIVEGAKITSSQQEISIDDALEHVIRLAEDGMRITDACKEVAKESGFKKSELYNMYLKES